MTAIKKEASFINEEEAKKLVTKKKTLPKKKKTKIPVKNLTVKKKSEEKIPLKIESDSVFAEKAEKILEKEKLAAIKKPVPPKTLPVIKEKPKSSLGLYRKIAVSFIVLTVALLAIIFYFSFVKLTITVIPAEERISDNLIIDVYDQDKGNSETLAKEKIKGAVEEIELTKEQTFQSSGAIIVGEEVVGTVTIINNYTKNQPLVASTRVLSSDNKLYRLKETVNVPAGGKVEAEVYADKASPEMAISPTRFIIPGLWAGLQDKIYGESHEKFVYQKQTKGYIVQADLDKAASDLKNMIIDEAKNKFSQDYKGYNQVLFSIDENSVSTEIDGKINEEKKQFNGEITAKVIVVAFSKNEVEEKLSDKLSILVPDNKELAGINKTNITYTLSSCNAKEGVATINSAFEGKMVPKKNLEIVERKKLLGLSRQQLETYLNNLTTISGYQIKFTPSFINKAPKLIDRIEVMIK
ncbi:MAG: hypothetical protein PHU73_04280 [Patescibacteria group bacterium]|nr:hypothetical protein [Patescibacteria group bacterium]